MNLWVGKRWYLVKKQTNKQKSKQQMNSNKKKKSKQKQNKKNPHFYRGPHSLMGLRFYFYCLI